MKALLISISVALLAVSCASNSSTSAQVVKHNSQSSVATPRQANTIKLSRETILSAIGGLYKAAALQGEESQPCNLTIEIKRISRQYVYTLTLPGKVKKGVVTLSQSDNPKQFSCMLTLEGIKWASYEGNISQEDDEHPAKELEVPVGITMGFINNELTFQNNGNAMNAYTVLEECDQKYVRLVKQ
jgi:hypothetical protein